MPSWVPNLGPGLSLNGYGWLIRFGDHDRRPASMPAQGSAQSVGSVEAFLPPAGVRGLDLKRAAAPPLSCYAGSIFLASR